MPAITITPGSSAANVITLTYNAGALSKPMTRIPGIEFNTDGVSLERYIDGYNNYNYVLSHF